jgi:hypothetical protein
LARLVQFEQESRPGAPDGFQMLCLMFAWTIAPDRAAEQRDERTPFQLLPQPRNGREQMQQQLFDHLVGKGEPLPPISGSRERLLF